LKEIIIDAFVENLFMDAGKGRGAE
jgi:hypothetical protein